jgi:regulator of sigma E protease
LAEGWLIVLSFAGMLSINLAIMNVLPIPPLDGGRAVFILLELVFSRKQLIKAEHYLNYSGYFVLLALIILVTIRDVVRVFA